ncbi:hypothetical protein A4U49_07380 [Acidithiobacillus ferrivorans]|jgi:hypothetical protein|uniref:helix-turn-helix domain-containing protein n=1 Tax=Acidithiobacillus ferrivorans TaxID=160808 RepID=UPI000893CDA1|nr:helix-turn-helix domain-containing protein [Acidithiobacillus ferrivorans]OFA16439.1 hypothetical protein A4U49_07380 [Acidithiobacillus ferrivorans]
MAARKQLTAADWALHELQSGHAITHPDAIFAGKGWRLAARIYDLRKSGVQIVTRRDRRGAGVYSLPDNRQIVLIEGGAVASSAGDSADGEATEESDGGRHG